MGVAVSNLQPGRRVSCVGPLCEVSAAAVARVALTRPAERGSHQSRCRDFAVGQGAQHVLVNRQKPAEQPGEERTCRGCRGRSWRSGSSRSRTACAGRTAPRSSRRAGWAACARACRSPCCAAAAHRSRRACTSSAARRPAGWWEPGVSSDSLKRLCGLSLCSTAHRT